MCGPAQERQLLGLVETGWAADGRGWGFEESCLPFPSLPVRGTDQGCHSEIHGVGEHEGPSWTLATQGILLAMPREESNALRGCA